MSNQATLNISQNMISYSSKSFPVQVQAALKLIDAEFVSKSGTQAVNDWLNTKGGATLAKAKTVDDLALSVEQAKRFTPAVAELVLGMVAGRMFYSSANGLANSGELAVQQGGAEATKEVCSVLGMFDDLSELDEAYAEAMAVNMASNDLEVLQELFEQAPSAFAKGAVVTWMVAHAQKQRPEIY